jgi:hypothetical protein
MLKKTDDLIFIPGNVTSKKNSKQIWWKSGQMKGNVKAYRNGQPVTPFIHSSDANTKYEKDASWYYNVERSNFKKQSKGKNLPLIVGFHFIRSTKAKFDFGNMCQVILDLMQKHEWIENDHCDIILPIPLLINNSAYTVDKENAGIFIKIMN